MDRRDSRAAAAGIVVVLGLLMLVGCTSADTGSAACDAAFRNADPRALPADGVSPLDDAVRTCRTVGDWQAAWNVVPSAHTGHDDAIAYLRNRCEVASLASTILCLELAGGPNSS